MVAIVGMIAGITYPAVSNGLESVRLASASDTVASFLNAALNRVERRQEVLELGFPSRTSSMVLHSTEPVSSASWNCRTGSPSRRAPALDRSERAAPVYPDARAARRRASASRSGIARARGGSCGSIR